MSAEIQEVRDFLAAHHPFDLLPKAVLGDVARSVQIIYARRGTVLMKPGDTVDTLYVVRTGAAETRDPDGHLLARPCEGECFGVRALLRGGVAVNRIEVIEDSLLYTLSADLFQRLRQDHSSFSYFFAAFDGGRIGDAMKVNAKDVDFLSKQVSELLTRVPVTSGPDIDIRHAAQRMRDHRVSCLLVTDDHGGLAGILTDRDLRGRVVAEGLDYATPITQVMTPNPRCVQAETLVFDAMLLMSRHNIHHLPVLKDGAVAGCLTTSTVVDSQSASPLYMAKKVHGATEVAQLKAVISQVPSLVEGLASQGANTHGIGHVVSALTDAVAVRLLNLSEARFGPPPVPYAWLAAGSQARQEQTAVSDQDNCVILHDSYDPVAHGPYFKQMMQFVSDGLNECGYVYCPGEMMATTDKWRQPLAVWHDYFRRWIEEPDPKALMLSSIFFDLRLIHGDAGLFEDLHQTVLEKCRKNRIFQAYMATNALTHRPPLGFFRNLVLISGGDHDHTMDLKHNGIVPIVDLARVYALAGGVKAVNTFERLEAAREAKVLSTDGADDLRDALEFISMIRLRHQAARIRGGMHADNYVSPDELSSFDRSHLKAAFGVVKTLQAALASAYQLGRF
ncbi:MAG: cyclic nucleotide-binding/CBS domain-containing protein [Magnetospirillum gryphiswaldense]|nr:cyclic nucleotide-binding/CBS domain-containing protein [Magnetospirillum gryphiswaldense]